MAAQVEVPSLQIDCPVPMDSSQFLWLPRWGCPASKLIAQFLWIPPSSYGFLPVPMAAQVGVPSLQVDCPVAVPIYGFLPVRMAAQVGVPSLRVDCLVPVPMGSARFLWLTRFIFICLYACIVLVPMLGASPTGARYLDLLWFLYYVWGRRLYNHIW